MISIKYWIMACVVFALLLVPLYTERHAYVNAFFNHPRICYGVGYTGAPAFSQCESQFNDCFTTTSGGTICTRTDTVDVIAFGGVSLIFASLMLLTSMTLSYPISKRLGWL